MGEASLVVADALETAARDGTPGSLYGWFALRHHKRGEEPAVAGSAAVQAAAVQLRVQYLRYD